MRQRNIFYLIYRGKNEYLKALVGPEGETDVTKMWPTFTIYHHDAAKFDKVTQAQQAIRALRKEGETWNVSRYNTLTFYEEKLSERESQMRVTEKMRLERSLKYLEDEKWHEEKGIQAIENICLAEVVIIRNKKHMYLAEVNQAIRNIKARLDELAEDEEAIAS